AEPLRNRRRGGEGRQAGGHPGRGFHRGGGPGEATRSACFTAVETIRCQELGQVLLVGQRGGVREGRQPAPDERAQLAVTPTARLCRTVEQARPGPGAGEERASEGESVKVVGGHEERGGVSQPVS